MNACLYAQEAILPAELVDVLLSNLLHLATCAANMEPIGRLHQRNGLRISPLPFVEGSSSQPRKPGRRAVSERNAAPNKHPLSPSDSSPYKGEQNFWFAGLCRVQCGCRIVNQRVSLTPPSPPGRGTGEGLFNHQRHRPRRWWFHRANDPLRPFGPTPPTRGSKTSGSAT